MELTVAKENQIEPTETNFKQNRVLKARKVFVKFNVLKMKKKKTHKAKSHSTLLLNELKMLIHKQLNYNKVCRKS